MGKCSRPLPGNLPHAPETVAAWQVSDAHVVRDRTSGASRGFGFVTFVDPTIAKAVQMADGVPVVLAAGQAKLRIRC